ncbi:MAG: tRNA (adenosine(37)-N6)-threonylcarbamoyltransferase complex ATPase subunit type 1 TsaE [Proteobacteria bacterium]|nr:tRNA (adenosine(37)-N6)-threonylcarbamoyltransferase complex ATPase subunit type 1 TsaE [Pseudomonadota bacterium]
MNHDVGTIACNTARRTRTCGRRLGLLLQPGDVVGLEGELGAGKTLFVGGVAAGLGLAPGYRVASPTFTLINEYPGRLPIVHVDLYRLDDQAEMQEIGILDYLGGPCVCLVEWFGRLAGARLPDHLQVTIEVTGDHTRRLRVAGSGPRASELVRRWIAACAS